MTWQDLADDINTLPQEITMNDEVVIDINGERFGMWRFNTNEDEYGVRIITHV